MPPSVVDQLAPLLFRGSHHPEPKVIPRPVVTFVVLVSLAIVAADVGFQFVPGSGHTANPLIDAPLIALIAATITGAKGPKPETAHPAPPAPTAPMPATEHAPAGRHRSEGPS